ncbi:MAG: Fe-S cluster assembly protein SufD, partial [Burkholderiales bacterium]
MKNWSEHLRGEAGARAAELGLPGPKHEAWRLIDLSALYGQKPAAGVLPAAGVPTAGVLLTAGAAGVLPTAGVPDIDAQVIAEAHRIVFVDGCFSRALSDLPEDEGLRIAPLGLEDAALHAHFGKSLQDEAFAQLNTRDFTDCAWIHVKGVLEKPIHVLHVATRPPAPAVGTPAAGTPAAPAVGNTPAAGNTPASCCMRCLVVLEPHAQALLVEEYAGSGESCLVNAMTEIVVGESARLRHVRVQSEGMQSVHIGNTAVTLDRDAGFDSTSLAFGARLSRHFMHLVHQGEGAHAHLDGLILTEGRQVSDEHTRIDHRVPHCSSVQRHKCIAGGASTAVFSGNIVVHRGAKGTDTRQESRNLLLSGRAKIDAQPQLEILNDDVSCKHGATVGQIDAESLFYLKSRGIDEASAKKLLIYAFAAEIVDRI